MRKNAPEGRGAEGFVTVRAGEAKVYARVLGLSLTVYWQPGSCPPETCLQRTRSPAVPRSSLVVPQLKLVPQLKFARRGRHVLGTWRDERGVWFLRNMHLHDIVCVP